MTETVTFNRRELYDLVWATPFSTLALQFGISDRGLAKICERHRVPTPPRGYWAKLAAGGKPKRAVFVETHDAAANLVEISPSLSTAPVEAREILQRAKLQRKAQQAAKRVDIAERPSFSPISEVSPILKATAKALRKDRLTGLIALSAAGMVTLRISSESVERVLALLERLFGELASRGHTIDLEEKGCRVSQGTDELLFTLKERTEFRPHDPSPQEIASEKKRQAQLERSRSTGSWEFWNSNPTYPANERLELDNLCFRLRVIPIAFDAAGRTESLKRWRNSLMASSRASKRC